MDILINGSLIESVELVIFDKDGTLTDLYSYWSWVANERARLICMRLGLGEAQQLAIADAMGLDLAHSRFKPEGPIGVKKRTEVAAAVEAYLSSIGKIGAASVVDESFTNADKNAAAHLHEIVKPLPGAVELVRAMQGKCKVAVATADLTKRAESALAMVGISHLDSVVGGDRIKKSKPDPESIEIVLSELGANRGNTIIIGDSKYDMLCGKNAGIMAGIGVCTGLTSKEELSASTKYVAGTLRDVQVKG
jgi:phosphoglycolate phosphatase